MADKLSSVNIVEELRLKTEQSDMSQFLKSFFGGYSKASVHEYLSVLRKQQQAMSETFSKNQQLLFDEKEKLRKENESLKRSLDVAVTEYDNLKRSFKLIELEDGEGKASDLPAFKKRISVYEEELEKLGIENNLLSNRLAQKSKAYEELSEKIAAFDEEKRAVTEMLRAEMLELKNQRFLVSKLNAAIEERDTEIEALSALMSEGEIAKRNETIARLNELLKEQNELLEKYTEEKEANSRTIYALGDENEALRNHIARLTEAMEELTRQNDKLSYTAKLLTEQLEAEYRETLSLIKEKSALAVEKTAVSRKLEETNSRMALLEQRLKKHFEKEPPQDACQVKSEKLIISAEMPLNAESK